MVYPTNKDSTLVSQRIECIRFGDAQYFPALPPVKTSLEPPRTPGIRGVHREYLDHVRKSYEKLEPCARKWDNIHNNLSVAIATHAKEGLMLATRHRIPRNPLFQFHPLHTLFSLVGTLVVFGLLVWFLAVPAK